MIQNLPVAGMTCAACVSRVEKNLKKMSGVTNAIARMLRIRGIVGRKFI